MFDDRFFSCLLDEMHFYEAIWYVELNPYKAKMENDFGSYYWNSSQEHLKIRNQFYLNKLPKYFRVENWKEYLKEGVYQNEITGKIESYTMSGFPLGDNIFIEKVSKKLGRDLKKKKKGRPKKLSVPI